MENGVATQTMNGNWRTYGGKWTSISDNNIGWGHPSSRHDKRNNSVHIDGHVEAYTIPMVSNPWAASPFNDATYMKGDD